jgi:hypothetical protein
MATRTVSVVYALFAVNPPPLFLAALARLAVQSVLTAKNAKIAKMIRQDDPLNAAVL